MPRHLEGWTLRPIVSFLLGTGARRGEALALRWKDVDLEKGTVRIERSILKAQHYILADEPVTFEPVSGIEIGITGEKQVKPCFCPRRRPKLSTILSAKYGLTRNLRPLRPRFGTGA